MPAVYPGSIKSFTTKVNNVEIIDASHPNTLQEEVVAIETTLGTNPALGTANLSTATYDNNGTLFSNVSARIANIEKGIVGDTHTQYLKKTGGTVTGTVTMSGATITGVPNPTSSSEVANKAYVDAAVTGGIGGIATPVSPLLLGGL